MASKALLLWYEALERLLGLRSKIMDPSTVVLGSNKMARFTSVSSKGVDFDKSERT